MTTDSIPPAVRKKLAAELKSLRGKQRQEDIVNALLALPNSANWSVSKLSRIENALARVQPDEVEDLCTVYQCEPADTQRLKEWAKAARSKGRWQQKARHVPENMIGLVEYETAAVVQRICDPLLVPALCQTPEYAAAIIAGVERGIDPAELELRVEARLARQAVLTRDDPQEVHVVLDERVIRGEIGSRDVRIGQLRHLVAMASRPNVTLQVVPAGVGAHPGIVGWFTLLEFPDDTPDIVYTDGPGGSIYLEDAEDVRHCTLVFGQLTATALSAQESVMLLEAMIERLSQESQ